MLSLLFLATVTRQRGKRIRHLGMVLVSCALPLGAELKRKLQLNIIEGGGWTGPRKELTETGQAGTHFCMVY